LENFISFLLLNGKHGIDNIYAYIDPGLGSVIIQVVIAAVLGFSYVIKANFKRIISFFRSSFRK